MALDLLARYPGQLAATDLAGYPYGKAQNVTVEGDGTGTPFEQDIVNDTLGFLQALLVASGLTPSGVPDKATASQYLDAIRWVAEASRATFNVKRYGAIGNGAADDTAAIQAAFAAAAAVRGRVYFPDGNYRVVAALSIPVGVSWFAVGNAVILKDHASNDTCVWTTGGDTGCGVTIENIRFEAAQVNTGRVWFAQGGATPIVTFVRCSVNRADDKLRGPIGRFDSAGAKVTFIDCACKLMDTGNYGLSGSGTLVMRGGEYSVPAAYTNDFTSFNVARYYGVSFTQLLSSTGGFAFIFAPDAIIQGCRFRVTDNGAPTAFTFAYAIPTGATIVASGNDFGNDSIGYCYPCMNIGSGAAVGSKIQGLPIIQNASEAASFTLRSYVEAYQIWSTRTAPPSLVWEAPLFEGQTMDLNVRNQSGTNWAVTLSSVMSGPYYKSSDFGTLINGAQLSARFVSQTLVGGGLSWVQAGAAVTF